MPDVFTFRLNHNVLKLSAKLHKSFPVHNFMLKIFVHAPENLLIILGLIGRSVSQFPRFIPYICRFYLLSNCLTDSIFFQMTKPNFSTRIVEIAYCWVISKKDVTVKMTVKREFFFFSNFRMDVKLWNFFWPHPKFMSIFRHNKIQNLATSSAVHKNYWQKISKIRGT